MSYCEISERSIKVDAKNDEVNQQNVDVCKTSKKRIEKMTKVCSIVEIERCQMCKSCRCQKNAEKIVFSSYYYVLAKIGLDTA